MPVQDWNVVDPFTQVYQVILQAMASDSPLQGICGVMGVDNNLPDMTDQNFQMPKDSLDESDTPYLLLEDAGFMIHPFGANSKIANFDQTFRVTCYASDLRLLKIHMVKTRLLVIAAKLGPSMGLDGMVRDFVIADSKDDRKKVMGGERFVSVADIEVHSYVPTAYLASL